MPKFEKHPLRKLTEPIESAVLSPYYFSIQKCLSFEDKFKLLWRYLVFRLAPKQVESRSEITFVLYSKACERMLTPLILNLLERPEIKQDIRIKVVLLEHIHRLRLTPTHEAALQKAGCSVEKDYFSLIQACAQPKGKLVVLCLDHRFYIHHRWGVETVDTLRKFGVKTLSIQHGGTRKDSVEGQATAASDTVLVWGERVFRELMQLGVNISRLRLVGNPLHDRITTIDPEAVKQRLIQTYPHLAEPLATKKVLLAATCLHTEYRGLAEEPGIYQDYMKHLYKSVDFSKTLLLIKMHPLDTCQPNLYLQTIPPELSDADVTVIEANQTDLDIYSLLKLSDALITRASTVAEEALMMGKQVVSFDYFAEGPAKGYRHLEEYGVYQTVYPTPEKALQEAINQALEPPSPDPMSGAHKDLAGEFTYRLDGQSTARAADVALKELATVGANEQELINSPV
ncbi:MAG: hypothetical protein QNJ46_02185 [Leptolyngbyaceae cyanobacterium MO_188.B28]|nr:hypothetical protein [Leptolyngbyaceae cyanobacterium MO_188.B28]